MVRRLPVVGGNWKMHTTRGEARVLLGALRTDLDGLTGTQIVVCPPAPWLSDAADALAGSTLDVGAQDVHWEPKGAFTGAISAPMLAGVASWVIVGHSERRHIFGETAEETNAKLRAVLAAGLRPILAVGERQEESGRTADVLRRQLDEGLRGIDRLPAEVVIAYEPVWAIGTGLAATPDDAQARCALIRSMLAERFGAAAAEACRIQYGGSVNAQNIVGYARQPDIDGALVGGASLDAAAFTAICRAVAAA
ncbi:MAG: triose-phosphate isomerase [Dehalococcoidia bacterium]|nr:MAG: triose-phosphate isomerase [Dehalococcoidia bacterium]